MEAILELARRNGPTDLTISLKQNTAELHSSKSLFRLKTYLEGAVDMYNATFESRRIGGVILMSRYIADNALLKGDEV